MNVGSYSPKIYEEVPYFDITKEKEIFPKSNEETPEVEINIPFGWTE